METPGQVAIPVVVPGAPERAPLAAHMVVTSPSAATRTMFRIANFRIQPYEVLGRRRGGISAFSFPYSSHAHGNVVVVRDGGDWG
jgi:hypothetical protein